MAGCTRIQCSGSQLSFYAPTPPSSQFSHAFSEGQFEQPPQTMTDIIEVLLVRRRFDNSMFKLRISAVLCSRVAEKKPISMLVLLIVDPKCTLAASHAAHCR